MMKARKQTRSINLGGIQVGAGAPISIQSMCTTRTADIEATVGQVRRLAAAGCEIIRVSVLDKDDAEALSEIKKLGCLPLVADIHFDYRLALTSIAQGIDCLRINPGNIGDKDRIKAVVEAAAEKGIPIRIGVNGGSLEDSIVEKYGTASPEGMLESAMRHVRILEDLDFHDIKVSLKASDPLTTIEANRLFSNQSDIPLHLGVTEAGPLVSGAVRSSAALAILLSEGIGDTLRISLSADPVEEVRAARTLLSSLGLRKAGVRVVSCPTCGRCQVSNMFEIAERVEARLAGISADLTVAVMGCAVNGPGEARDADIAAVCGKNSGLIYVLGKKVKTVPQDEIEDALLEKVQELIKT